MNSAPASGLPRPTSLVAGNSRTRWVLTRGALSAIVLGLAGCPEQCQPVPGPTSGSGIASLWQQPILTQANAIDVDLGGNLIRAQVPGYPDYFIGRNNCMNDGNVYCLVLKKMDWSTYKLTQVRELIQVASAGVQLGDGNIIGAPLGAYDPDIASFNAQLWVAFECGHIGVNYQGTTSLYDPPVFSTCMGVLNVTNGIEQSYIEMNRSYVAVLGQSNVAEHPNHYSASVPKLLVFNGHVYLYWTAVQVQPQTSAWVDLSTRGVELSLDPTYNLLQPVHIDGTVGGMVHSYSSDTTEVWGVEASDPASNVAMDSFHVTTDGQAVYAVGAQGGGDCLDPFGDRTSDGCYRLAIARSFSPLGERIFNSPGAVGECAVDADASSSDNHVPLSLLPSNPALYGFFFHHPSGQQMFMSVFLPKAGPTCIEANLLNVDPPTFVADPNNPHVNGRALAFPIPQ